jgi:hypothetical protein
MRELQRKYFATKERSYLERAKAIEREIDGDLVLIQAVLCRCNALSLQAGNSVRKGVWLERDLCR